MIALKQIDPSGTGGRRDLFAREIEMAERMTRYIEEKYPGYIWKVEVNLHGQYKAATIQLPVLMSAEKKHVIPSRFLCTENEIKRQSQNGAAELLERFNVPRSCMKFAEVPYLEARAKADVFRLKRKAPFPT